MVMLKIPLVLLLLLLFLLLGASEASVKLLKAPAEFSRRSFATFTFEALQSNGDLSNCFSCNFTCRLDNGISSNCEAKGISYSNLKDGKHTFEVCTKGLQEIGCATFNWTIDTINPTAYLTAPNAFTNALNFTVNVSFSEPCLGGAGFQCLSADACNLLVYGGGEVIPNSLTVLQPNLKYSLSVSLSEKVQYGRVILVMDRNFCSDKAGNRFVRTENSSFYVHYDRRNVFVNLRLHIPERLIKLNGQTRTVLATNNHNHLKVYLYFSEPVLNSSAQLLNTLETTQGSLVPIDRESIGSRRFGFLVQNVSSVSIVSLSLASNLIISRQGTPVSSISSTTFLFDSKRPSVKLRTTSSTRTKEHNIPISITFVKPVFDFNSSHVSVSGGNIESFRQISTSIYVIGVKASGDVISVHVPENVTGDVSGNKNLASNELQVRHYSVPLISSVVSSLVTASFLAAAMVSAILTFSTASLQTLWTFKGPSSLRTDPSRNLFRIACHIQVFALSRWLAVMLPVEYYEFASGLQWAIPYFHLPWENGHSSNVMVGSSPYTSLISHTYKPFDSENFEMKEGVSSSPVNVYGLPLDPMEYRFYFENPNTKPEAEILSDPQNTSGWTNFNRSMFWLALIGGGLVLLHVILLFLLKLRRKSLENLKGIGAFTFPRFEIFLLILALPCLTEVSAALVKGKETSGVIVGVLLVSLVALLLAALFVFLSIGITFAKLLQYKEVHKEGLTFRWYHALVRASLGPGKRGQWTPAPLATSSRHLIALGPLFEDLRGPPKYMLTQIGSAPGKRSGDRIIASDDETEDSEAPLVQKIFGILRIYYTLIEIGKRIVLAAMAGVFMEDWSSKTPSLVLLCATSFQLFFLVLKKPFIKKRVQLAEIFSVASEVGLFASMAAISDLEFSDLGETRLGALMVIVFLVGHSAQMVNEWHALYRQTLMLDPQEKSIARGAKIALIGSWILFLPKGLVSNLELKHSAARANVNASSSEYKSSSQSSGANEKPWLKQLRELAKASFTKEGGGASNSNNDPSSSGSVWSGIWGKKSGSPGLVVASADFKPNKPRGLYGDMEAIFASN